MSTVEAQSNKPFFSDDREQIQTVESSFLRRNIVWVFLVLVLVLGALGTTIGLQLFYSPLNDPVDACVQLLAQEAEVTTRIGEPIQRGASWELSGEFKNRPPQLFALLERFEISGPQGTAAVYGTMYKPLRDLDWRIWQMVIEFEDGIKIKIPSETPSK